MNARAERRRHIERLATEIRRGDWSCAEATLQQLELIHDLRAVYELGLRVGQWSYGDALARAARDGWTPLPGDLEAFPTTDREEDP